MVGETRAIGAAIGDRFEPEEFSSVGGMGVVYRAHDRLTGGQVALKVLTPFAGEDEERLARFDREAQVLAALDHEGIVRYIAHGDTPDGGKYLVMEWLDGEDLSSRLQAGALSIEASVATVGRVAGALGVAHARGIVHRDVKPQNLFIPAGDLNRIKVLDFGVARLVHPTIPVDVTRAGARLGTPTFMSPEQVRGVREVDARADVFALGCVLFNCLTGRRPFDGEDEVAVYVKILIEEAARPSDLRAEVPPALDELCARMLAKDPAERPADGAAVAAELARLAQGASPAVRSGRSALTEREQRLVGVVLVGATPAPEATVDGRTGGGDRVLPAIMRTHGGRLDRLADGSLVVSLTGTGAGTDQAARAARCALALRAVLPGAPIVLCTGRGLLVAGSRLMGEVIDRAVRLLRVAGDGAAIAIDEVSAGLLDARFDVGGDGDGLFLRGERDVLEVQRTLLGRPTPFVGRERELAMLDAILTECAGDSVPRVVLVTGGPGLGKSRLRHEFLRRLAANRGDVEVWISRADPMSAGSPLALIAPTLRRAAGILDGESPAVRRQKLRARVTRNLGGEPLPRVIEFLGELAGVPFPDERSVQLRAARHDPVLLGDQMLRAWQELIAAETSARPVLHVIEDLQWGDLPTVKFIDAALRNLPDRPYMVLALARPEVHEQFPRLWAGRGVTEIQLGELSRRACERLVKEMLPDAGTELVGRLCAQAAGNAFYLEELIRAAAAGDGRALPETVLAMVQARLEALPPEARRVLRAASIFGEAFWRRGLSHLLGDEGGARLGHWLNVLCESELVQRRAERRFVDEEEYVFRHGLVREAAYATLTDKDRTLGHRLAGEWLEQAGEGVAVVLAEHFERGGEPARAVAWYQRAAEQALGGNDLETALIRAGRGIACGAGGEALGALELLQAEACGWLGHLDDAERWAQQALRNLPRGTAGWWRAAGEQAFASGSLARYENLVALVEEMRAAPAAGGERARIIAIARAVAVLYSGGRYALAGALFDDLDGVAGALVDVDPAVAGAVGWARGWRATYLRDLAGALHHRAAAADRYEQAGDLRSACQQRAMLGSVYNKVGSFAQAVATLRPALALAQRMAMANVIGLVQNNLGFALCSLGDLDEGMAVEHAAVAAFQHSKNLRLESASRTYLARFLAVAGDLEAAEREARAAVELAATTPPMRAQALATLAGVRLRRGDVADALAAAGEAQDLLDGLGGIDEGESLVRLALAEALEAAGRSAEARAAIAEARARLLARAEAIADPELRATFLSQVPDNARTLALASAWMS